MTNHIWRSVRLKSVSICHRTDLFLQWPLTPQGFLGTMQQVVLELKIQHKGKAATLAAGLTQTARYADAAVATAASKCGGCELMTTLIDYINNSTLCRPDGR